MNLSGKLGSSPSTSAPSAPPSPARPEPTAKVSRKMRFTSMPRPLATRASSTAARSRLPKRVRARTHCSATVSAAQTTMMNRRYLPMPTPARSKRPCSHAGSWTICWLRADEVVDRGHRHEDEADREQHLVEVRLRVHRPVQRAFEQRAERADADEGERQAPQEGHAEPLHQQHRDVAAGHREGAVREVDEVHQPERDGQPDRQHEQQHAVGDAVEEQGQHGARGSMSAVKRGRRAGRLGALAPTASAGRHFVLPGSFTAFCTSNSTL